ncbi:MAG: TIGR00730 family Rossman fold protein [bacterium]|nr:TIGR00730 family Rossman fold protein [bacterium]
MNEDTAKSEENHLVCPISRGEFCTEMEKRVARIAKEFHDGFIFITSYPKSVSFFGSARFTPDNPHSKQAEHLAGRIVKEIGYAVTTGGNAGIMEAANKGAFEAGGESIGLNIRLQQEKHGNSFTTASLDFSYFFSRKTMLSYAAEAYIFMPGGFGTLDELFEIITLVQTRKIRRIPIFLVGKDYWEPLDTFIRTTLYEVHQTISKHDLDLYVVTDDEDEILEAIRKVPIADGLMHQHHKEKKTAPGLSLD